jgi:hypothetical protein
VGVDDGMPGRCTAGPFVVSGGEAKVGVGDVATVG